jgi:Fe-S cluster assembly protein SufD
VLVQVALGGDVVRSHQRGTYTARAARRSCTGSTCADGGQHLEHRPARRPLRAGLPAANVAYRGALQGKDAHTVVGWGDVLIRTEATGTDTYEVKPQPDPHRAERARTHPNLEIETGEVIGAGHASATGRFDDEQLFYLMARGIPETEARKLVVRGFFTELLAKIPVEELRERLGAQIEARLVKAEA